LYLPLIYIESAFLGALEFSKFNLVIVLFPDKIGSRVVKSIFLIIGTIENQQYHSENSLYLRRNRRSSNIQSLPHKLPGLV